MPSPYNPQIASKAALDFTNSATLFVDPNANASISNGTFFKPYRSIVTAIQNSSSGNTIHVMRGIYNEGSSKVEMVPYTSLFCEPGTIWQALAPDDGNGQNYAFLKPNDNCIIDNLRMDITPTNSNSDSIAIGFGHSQSGGANVIIKNVTINSDGIAFYANSFSGVNWTIINPIANAPVTYIQGNGNTGDFGLIINPIFDITNPSITAEATLSKRRAFTIGLNAGKFIVLGGITTVGDQFNTGTPSMVFENKSVLNTTVVSGAITANGLLIKGTENYTHSLSADIRLQGATGVLNLINVARIDRKPLTYTSDTPLYTSSIPAHYGSSLNSRVFLFNQSPPTIYELLQTGSTYGVCIGNSGGLPVAYYTSDGINVSMKILAP